MTTTAKPQQGTRRRFMVVSQGRLQFPIDMLRYDACWPESQQDVRTVEDPGGNLGDDGRARVLLQSDSPSEPASDRWASFGWNVHYVERVWR